MKDLSGIQSLDRGLAVLKLLAENKTMTASSLAEKLGVHQSSASRLLQSLQKAGFVCKPDFHSFALDYGVLLFAGAAMNGFPIVKASVKVCNSLKEKYGCGAAVAILREDRLIYFARIMQKTDASLELIDNSSFPVHRSSLGLALCYLEGKERMRKIIRGSMIENGETDYTLDGLCQAVAKTYSEYGFVYMKDFGKNALNSAMTFDFNGTKAALAVFADSQKKFSPSKTKEILKDGIQEILASV